MALSNVASADEIIHLVEKDEETFDITSKAAKNSMVIKKLLDKCKVDLWAIFIYFPKVGREEMAKIVAFLEMQINDSIDPVEWIQMLKKNEVDAAYLQLVNMDAPSISHLRLAAEYMKIQPLVALCEWKLAGVEKSNKVSLQKNGGSI